MANMCRCEKGLHIYDAQRHTLCPYCSSAVFVFDDNESKDKDFTKVIQPTNANDQVTRKLVTNGHQERVPSEKLTKIINPSKTDANNLVTRKLDFSDKPEATLSVEDNKTIREIQPCSDKSKQANAAGVLRPVVAWLVIIEGPGEGLYTPIFSGANLIGLSKYEGSVQQYKQELCLDFSSDVDRDIEKKAHLKINYDKKSQYYSLQNGDVGLINLNSVPVEEIVTLSAYDRIEIGKMVMMFIPFCGQYFQWPGD